MIGQDEYVRALVEQRLREAQAAALRSRIIAARRSKRHAETTSRWIRLLLVATR
jgi:hypothetical protein